MRYWKTSSPIAVSDSSNNFKSVDPLTEKEVHHFVIQLDFKKNVSGVIMWNKNKHEYNCESAH